MIQKRRYKHAGKLQQFSGAAAWIYLPIPTEKIPDVPRAGWGSVPLTVTLGKTTWETSIFPMGQGHYFIPVKRQVCRAEGVDEGDEVALSYVVRR